MEGLTVAKEKIKYPFEFNGAVIYFEKPSLTFIGKLQLEKPDVMLFSLTLLESCAVGWEKVFDEAGQPLSFSKETFRLLIDYPPDSSFFAKITDFIETLLPKVAEKSKKSEELKN